MRSSTLLRRTFPKLTENTDQKSIPRCRFIQYYYDKEQVKRVGMVSEDGTKIIEITDGSSESSYNMMSLINSKFDLAHLRRNVSKLPTENIGGNFRLLPPITNPSKIICVGLNYMDHCTEQDVKPPTEPVFFSKFSSSIIGALDPIHAHKIARRLDYEVELAVIIGSIARKVSRSKAMDYVFGYTIAQDITARDWQKRNGGQFLIGKSMDTFCPLGPAIVHKSEICNVNNLSLKTLVNGVEKQCSNTSNMIFKIDEIIYRLSQLLTLQPGDVILTGTPAGVGCYRNPREFLKPGDLVESEIQTIGKMKNRVICPN